MSCVLLSVVCACVGVCVGVVDIIVSLLSMEEPALWRPAAAAETKDRGMESTRESKSRIRNKSIAAVPAPRSQPNRRVKSDLGSKMFMAGSSVASRPCPRRGSLSMLAYQSRMLELEKSGAACVRYVTASPKGKRQLFVVDSHHPSLFTCPKPSTHYLISSYM